MPVNQAHTTGSQCICWNYKMCHTGNFRFAVGARYVPSVIRSWLGEWLLTGFSPTLILTSLLSEVRRRKNRICVLLRIERHFHTSAHWALLISTRREFQILNYKPGCRISSLLSNRKGVGLFWKLNSPQERFRFPKRWAQLSRYSKHNVGNCL